VVVVAVLEEVVEIKQVVLEVLEWLYYRSLHQLIQILQQEALQLQHQVLTQLLNSQYQAHTQHKDKSWH
jgi:hypothetical protein